MANDFSVADVLAWARTKPADERYCYTSNGHCAIAQFLRDTGRSSNPDVGGNHGMGAPWTDNNGKRHYSPVEVAVAAVNFPRTFGEFVKRLEAIVQETPVQQSVWLSPDAYRDVPVDLGDAVPARAWQSLGTAMSSHSAAVAVPSLSRGGE